MGRIWTTGFELNSITAGIEVDANGGTVSVQTSVVRSGTYALRVNPTNSFGDISHKYSSSNQSGAYFFRVYLRIASLPSATDYVVIINDNNSNLLVGIQLTTAGKLQLFDGNAGVQVGSDSSALSTNTWYRIELKVDTTTPSSTAVDARIDGTSFASGTRNLPTGIAELLLGAGLLNGSMTTDLYFDDVAINDSSGSNQTSYPGAGSIVHLRPSAAGDNAGWIQGDGGSSNWGRVSDVTPDDVTTYNKTSGTSQQIDDHNIDDTPSAIGSSDTINVVQVGFRGQRSTSNSDPFVLRIKSQASGTLLESSAVNLVSAWATNASAIPRNYPLTSYTDPQSGGAWTKALLDTAQIGYRSTPSAGAVAWVSAAWALVDYTPSSTTNQFQTGVSRITALTIKTLTALSRITATTLKTQTALSRITATAKQIQNGISRITATTIRVLSGITRITAVSKQFQSGITRMTVKTTQVQSGKSNVGVLTKQMQSAISRITVLTKQIQSGLTRITSKTIKTQSAVSRVTIITKQILNGLSRITIYTIQIIAGKASLVFRTIQTMTGKTKVTSTTKQMQSGVTKITSAFGLYRSNKDLYIDE